MKVAELMLASMRSGGFFTVLGGYFRGGKSGVFALCLPVLLSFSPMTWADDVPFSAFNGPAYYASSELDAVKVALSVAHVKPVLSVPRAYINFAVGYEQPRYPTLPAAIETRGIKVSLRLSSGRPHASVSAATIGKEQAGEIRYDLAFVNISATTDAPRTIEAYRVARQKFREPELAGLSVWTADKGPYRAMEYFPSVAGSSFYGIACNNTGYKNQFCTYEIEICPHVVASAKFIDFRFHGGTKFAEDRAKSIRKTVRSWIKSCN